MDNLYTLFDLLILHKMILFATLFIIIVSVGLYWANQEDKRRIAKKAKEIGLDEFENEIRGDIRRHNNIRIG